MLEKILGYLLVCAIFTLLFSRGTIWRAAKKRWSGRIDSPPEPSESLMKHVSWAVITTLWMFGAGWATEEWGVVGFLLTLISGFILGVLMIYVWPYIRHQYRRIRGRPQPPPAER